MQSTQRRSTCNATKKEPDPEHVPSKRSLVAVYSPGGPQVSSPMMEKYSNLFKEAGNFLDETEEEKVLKERNTERRDEKAAEKDKDKGSGK